MAYKQRFLNVMELNLELCVKQCLDCQDLCSLRIGRVTSQKKSVRACIGNFTGLLEMLNICSAICNFAN